MIIIADFAVAHRIVPDFIVILKTKQKRTVIACVMRVQSSAQIN